MYLANILGLIGLISIIALIIIYIIKPNYQQKFISSTYVWQLSMKYRKKKLPVSKLRNIVLIICQILLLASCAMILARPYVQDAQEKPIPERIIVIDASASMRTESAQSGNKITRFERAVDMVKKSLNDAFNDGGLVSIILAENKADLLVQRAGSQRSNEVRNILDNLVIPNDLQCGYGASDIEGAMELCEDILELNSFAKVMLYTDVTYGMAGSVEVVDVKSTAQDEWNAAILDGRVTVDKMNTARFDIDIATYGKNANFQVCLTVFNANAAYGSDYGKVIKCTYDLAPVAGEKVTISLPQDLYSVDSDGNKILTNGTIFIDDVAIENTENVEIFSYESAQVSLKNATGENLGDSFSTDDNFWFYGGKKTKLSIQYVTTLDNPFTRGIISAWRSTLKSKWDFEVTAVTDTTNYQTVGYDIYLFEHIVPNVMPTDGFVILLDPRGTAPTGLGLVFENVDVEFQPETGSNMAKFALAADHPITSEVNSDGIEVSRYTALRGGPNYKILMTCGYDPVVLVNEETRVLIVSLDVNRTQTLNTGFSTMMLNAMNFFYPQTVSSELFDVNDEVVINAMNDRITLSTPLGQEEYREFPLKLDFAYPGQYTIYQQSLTNNQVVTNFYVKVPSSESDIFSIEDELINPYVYKVPPEEYMNDLLLYFAIALVALLVAEWWLQSRDQF